MTRISFLYPNLDGARFDIEYYIEKHMPWSIELLSEHLGFKGVSVERGVSGATPDAGPPYLMMCHFLFDSLDNFVAAVTPHLPALQADMQIYTDIAPTFQVSEVLISQSLLAA